MGAIFCHSGVFCDDKIRSCQAAIPAVKYRNLNFSPGIAVKTANMAVETPGP